MRRFRFIGDPEFYTDGAVERHRVYDSNEVIGDNEHSPTAIEMFDQYPNDWQEVFKETPFRQTDLGYYAGLAMVELIKVFYHNVEAFHDIPNKSMYLAKELIKQLKEECQDK